MTHRLAWGKPLSHLEDQFVQFKVPAGIGDANRPRPSVLTCAWVTTSRSIGRGDAGIVSRMDDATLDARQALQRYQELKNTIRTAEQEMAKLEPLIIEHLQEQGGKLKTDTASFSVSKRSRWEYSEQVTSLSDALKERKKLERDEGIATQLEPTTYVSVRFADPA